VSAQRTADPPRERTTAPADGSRAVGALARFWARAVVPALPRRRPLPPIGPEPARATWTRTLAVCLAGFGLWLLLDAPTLQHNAQVSPVGTRRSVSLDVLGPIATVSRGLGLSHFVSVTDGVLGRQGNRPGNGVVAAAPRRPTRHTPATGVRSTTTSVPAALEQHPTATHPERVLVLGDSLGIDLGSVLVQDLDQTKVVQATLDGKVDTGLARPDYFNWPAELSADLSRYTPEIVVVMIGANDDQDFPGPPDVPFGTTAWDKTYRARVSSFMAEAGSHGARVIWVGMPPMQAPGLSSAIQRINGLVQQAAARNRNVDYVPSWTLIGTASGQFTPYLMEGGREVNVREPDGTHISPGGAQVLSGAVESCITDHLHVAL
jgi:hypothetical protein